MNKINNYNMYWGTNHLICRGEGRGDYGGFFSSRNIFSENNFYFCRAKCEKKIPEFNIRLYDKKSESEFFFPPPKTEYFFSNNGKQNI